MSLSAVSMGELRERGWCLFTDAETPLTSLASLLGDPVSARRSAAISQTLRPIEPHDAQPRSMSSVVGMDRQPFHTDSAHLRNPPKYLMFRALAASLVPTLILNFTKLQLSDAESNLLSREVWLVNGGRGRFLAAIASQMPSVRFDPNVMRPAHPKFGTSRSVLERACDRSSPVGITWPLGQVLVLDNWRTLHARERVTASDASRALERVHIMAAA